MTVETITPCRSRAFGIERTDGVLLGFSAEPRKDQATAGAMRRRTDQDEQHCDDQRRCAQESGP